MSNRYIRDLTMNPDARKARQLAGIEEAVAHQQIPSGPRVVSGNVSSAGAITAGGGFTVNHSGTGDYVITFTNAFQGTPTANVTPIGSGVFNATIIEISAGSVWFRFANGAATATIDSAFSFEVREAV